MSVYDSGQLTLIDVSALAFTNWSLALRLSRDFGFHGIGFAAEQNGFTNPYV